MFCIKQILIFLCRWWLSTFNVKNKNIGLIRRLDSRTLRPVLSRYTLATKLNSTRSTLLKVDRPCGFGPVPYTLATKSTVSATKLNVSATKSTATGRRIHVVAALLPVLATVAAFNKLDRVEFNFVASVYRALVFSNNKNGISDIRDIKRRIMARPWKLKSWLRIIPIPRSMKMTPFNRT